MPRGIPNNPRKRAVKKTTRKAAKKAVKKVIKKATKRAIKQTTKKRSYNPQLRMFFDSIVVPAPEDSQDTPKTDSAPPAGDGVSDKKVPAGEPFSTHDMLLMRDNDLVEEARSRVTQQVRQMVHTALECERNATASKPQRKLLAARYNEAVAGFEAAMDELEQLLRYQYLPIPF